MHPDLAARGGFLPARAALRRQSRASRASINECPPRYAPGGLPWSRSAGGDRGTVSQMSRKAERSPSSSVGW